jgi:O-antigen ligase
VSAAIGKARTVGAIVALPVIALLVVPGLASPFLAAKAFALAVFAALLFAMASDTGLRNQPLFVTGIAAFLISQFVSAATSSRPELARDAVVFALCGPMLMLGTREIITERFDTWRDWVIAAAAVIAVVVIAQRLAGLPRVQVVGTLGNPLFAGTFLALCFVIALSAWVERPSAWNSVAAALICVGLALTGSRTAMCAAIAGSLALLIRREMRTRAAFAIAALALASVIALALNPRTTPAAARGRMLIAKVSLHEGVSAFGTGPDTFAAVYPSKLSGYFANRAHTDELRFAGYERHAHNEFVEVLVESGAIGLVAWVFLVGSWFWSIRSQLAERRTRCAAAAVVALLVASVGEFALHRAEMWALLWVAFGMGLPGLKPRSFLSVAHSAEAGCSPESATGGGENHERHRREARAHKTLCSAFLRSVAAIVLIALAAQPIIASRQTFLAIRAEESGDLAVAESHYRAAIAHSSASQDAQFGLPRTLCKQERFEECIAQSRIAANYVDEAELYLLRARALRDLGRSEQAQVELERARGRFPFSKALEREGAKERYE